MTTKFTPEQADQIITRVMQASAEINRKNYFESENAIQPTEQTVRLIQYLRNQLKDQSKARIEQRLSNLQQLKLQETFVLPLDEDICGDRGFEIQSASFEKLKKLVNKYAVKNNGANYLEAIENSLQEVEKLEKEYDDFVLSLRD